MKRLIITCLAAVAIICGSCKKLLDTKPQDFVTPETFFNKESDATAALNAAYDMLTRQWMFSGYYQYRMLVADDVIPQVTGVFPGNLKIDASESQAIPPMWNSMYTTIQYCNVLLENLPRVTMDETKKGVIRGEALFLRAFCYSVLVVNWGPVPLRIKPTAGPSDVNIAGSSIKEIYDQILADMTEAEALVPNTSSPLYGGAGYPAKTTVQAFLARTCLAMAGEPLKDVSKYQAAKDWAQKVFDSKEHALNPDYTNVFIKLAAGQFDKKEVLWEVDFNDITGSTEHGYIGYLNGIPNAANAYGASVGQVKITRKLYNSYGTGATIKDMRRDWNCSTFTWKSGASTGAESEKTYFTATQIYDRFDSKYRLDYTPLPRVNNRSPINFPMMRYSDVLLMLAEAENYLNGPTDLAYSCVNQVRRRAWGKMLAGATNPTEADLPKTYNKDSFLQELQNERLRELCSEAIRKHDLLRWGIFVSTLRALGADANDPAQPAVPAGTPKSQVVSLANLVSNRDLLWPMPATELTYNKLLKQNPGW